MELSPYLDGLRRDLIAAAAPGGPDVARAADLLAGSLEASVRLCLLEVLADAAAEITSRLDAATVQVQLRGREAQFVVEERAQPAPAAAPTIEPTGESGEQARISLRLPESLKETVERLAATENISVNAWLVRGIGQLAAGSTPRSPGRTRSDKRITGFAQS